MKMPDYRTLEDKAKKVIERYGPLPTKGWVPCSISGKNILVRFQGTAEAYAAQPQHKEPCVVAARRVLSLVSDLRRAMNGKNTAEIARYAFKLGYATRWLTELVKRRQEADVRQLAYRDHCLSTGKPLRGQVGGHVKFLMEDGLAKCEAVARTAALFKISQRQVWRQCQEKKA